MNNSSFEKFGVGSSDYEFITSSIRSAQSCLVELGIPADVDWRAAYFAKRHLDEAISVLAKEHIVLVDDQRRCLSSYALPLQIATHGNADFVLSGDSPLPLVVDKILHFQPSVVLIDYFFSLDASGKPRGEGQFTGADLVQALRARESEGRRLILVGFSADGMFDEFTAAGVNGATWKLDGLEPELIQRLGFDPTEQSVLEVARIVAALRSFEHPERSFTRCGMGITDGV